MRPLTALERNALLTLTREIGSDEERNQLLADLEYCEVEDVLSNGARLMFHIQGYERPAYRGQDTFRGADRFPVEGIMLDADNSEVDVFLYSDQNNRVFELELVKHHSSPVTKPNWESFRSKNSR